MKEITIFDNRELGKVVIGRDVLEHLGLSYQYTNWFSNILSRGQYKQGKDYEEFKETKNKIAYRRNHIITVNMAIHVIQRYNTESSNNLIQQLKQNIPSSEDYSIVNDRQLPLTQITGLEPIPKVNQTIDEVLPISTNENQELVVSGRKLHELLNTGTRYDVWFNKVKEFGFVESTDYSVLVRKKTSNEVKGFSEFKDHLMSLGMAKEAIMIQKTEVGSKLRKYLIEVEKRYNSPEQVMSRAILFSHKIMNDLKQKNVELLENNNKLSEKNDELEQKILEEKKKVELLDAYLSKGGDMRVREFAKLMQTCGYDIHEHEMFSYMRNKGLLLAPTSKGNTPSQDSINRGLLKLILKTTNGKEYYVSLITAKGRKYLFILIQKDFKKAV